MVIWLGQLKKTGKLLLLLDTHIWLWLVLGDKRIKKKWLTQIEKVRVDSNLYLSNFSVWEASMLIAKNRLIVNKECLGWIEQAIAVPGVTLVPMNPDIAVESTRLPGDFHGDPVDRIIVATARVRGMSLISADEKIVQFAEGGFVRCFN